LSPNGRATPAVPSRRAVGPVALVALALYGVGAGGPGLGAAEDPLAEPTRELQGIEQRLMALEAGLAERRARRATLGGELERCEREIGDLALAEREFGLLLAEQRQVKDALGQRLHDGRAALAREQERLAALVRSAYAVGGGGGLRLLLDHGDLSRLDRVLAYYGYLNRERQARLVEVRDQTQALEVLAREAVEEAERLTRLAAQKEAARQQSMAAREERAVLIAGLERDIATQREGIDALGADARALRGVIAQLARTAEIVAEADMQQVSLAQRKGQLPWPLTEVELLARYDAPRDASGQQRLDGVLLGAREGSEVRAIHHGRVVFADWLRGFGMLIVMDHGDGYMTLYGHNQTLLKEVGEWVSGGEPVALSGSSGGQRGGQLYFAIRRQGAPQDPQLWCRPLPTTSPG
jgi:murein hydrolase activator